MDTEATSEGEHGRGRAWRRVAAMLACALLALFGNLAHATLFFSIDFVFGSIAALLAAVAFGPVRGALVAVVGAVATLWLWDHGWAVLIFGAEAFVVGALVRRRRAPMVVADTLYWLVLGVPIILATYGGAMEMDASAVALVAVKQTVNGIVNALLASALATSGPVRRALGMSAEGGVSLQHLLFDLMVAMVLLPSLSLVVLGGREDLQRLERGLASQIATTARALEAQLERWRARHVHAVAQLTTQQGADARGLQSDLALLHGAFPDFHNLYVADEHGTAIAFHPDVNERGESTIGLNFADRPYYAEMRRTLSPYVSDVFLGRGGVFSPIIVIAAPIVREQRFAGYALGALDLSSLASMLRRHAEGTNLEVTLVDRHGSVVASTVPGREVLGRFDEPARGQVRVLEGDTYQRFPTSPGAPAMLRWKRSYYGARASLDGGAWTLYVEAPAAPQQAWLHRRYTRNLVVLLALTMVALLASWRLARRIGRSLEALATATTDLPDRLARREPLVLPDSPFSEVRSLSRNFREMTLALDRNFSENEKARRDLQEAVHVRDEFLSIASHELMTPVAALQLQLETLLRRRLDPAREAEKLARAAAQVERLRRLIDDLLDVSRITAGRLRLELEEVDLVSVLSDVIERATELHRGSAGVALRAEGPVRGSWDPLRIDQVATNLISNALKYGRGKPVEVVVRAEGDRAILQVVDRGVGISPEHKERIFERFERAVSTREYGGFGLGLWIAREIVEAHGGEIEVESATGEGSTFTVVLPLRAPAGAPIA